MMRASREVAEAVPPLEHVPAGRQRAFGDLEHLAVALAAWAHEVDRVLDPQCQGLGLTVPHLEREPQRVADRQAASARREPSHLGLDLRIETEQAQGTRVAPLQQRPAGVFQQAIGVDVRAMPPLGEIEHQAGMVL